MKDKLTIDELQRAERLGWTLAIVYDTRGYWAQAILPAPNSSLPNAGAAQQFVWDGARVGDALCRRALSIVAASEMAGKSQTKKKGRR